MSDSSDDTLAKAGAALARIQRGDAEIDYAIARGRQRRARALKRLARGGAAVVAILLAAAIVGSIFPLGMFGALGVIVLSIAAFLMLSLGPRDLPPAPEKLRDAPLKALPSQTGRWLDAQRPTLPAPAINLVDRIGVRLDALGPQLAALDDREPIAADVRKLVGEQLPEFVKGYARVPQSLRGVPRNGKTPDAELIDGLKVIEQEIGEMSGRLAEGDLDSLATRGRFLEIKYRGDEGA